MQPVFDQTIYAFYEILKFAANGVSQRLLHLDELCQRLSLFQLFSHLLL